MDRNWINARLATMAGDNLGIIENGVVQSLGGRIAYAGPAADAPAVMGETIDCEGRLITPGLIDCHTHLVHGGNRAGEWAMRLEGASYEDIARAGGGIVSTMHATREASEDELVASALPRLDALIAEGVTTVEIKSGYGLSTPEELKMLADIIARDEHLGQPVKISNYIRIVVIIENGWLAHIATLIRPFVLRGAPGVIQTLL